MSRAAAVFAILSLAAPLRGGEDEKPQKPKKPNLELRVSPRYSFSPANVMLTAELKGGDDVEELYCPEVQWEYGDGGKSVQEADCDPWAPGSTIERRFTAHHTYSYAGVYSARVTLRRSGKAIASQTVQVTVRAGLGDVRGEDPGL